jgi:hypothetical protein
MRTLVLYFPRLGIQLARKTSPELAGRPLALLAGEGDDALLSAASVEATADGVERGMTALQARQRCPAITLRGDNAYECLEALEAVMVILRSRATTSVAFVSRNTIAVSLAGLEPRFADEGAAAQGILGLARNWSGLDVRAAVGATIDEAACAARTARRFPAIASGESESPAALPLYEPVTCGFRWERAATASEAELRLGRMMAALRLILDEYGQSYRAVRVELEHGAYRSAILARPVQPIHRATEALDLIRSRLESGRLEGVTAIRVSLERPGPGVTVSPWRAHVAKLHQLTVPAVPVQRRLLRAS